MSEPIKATIPSESGPSWRAEVAVVGSGPGGAVTACVLAEAGKDVVLVEEGPYLPLESCAPFSLAEMVQKYRNSGLTVALGPAKVAYVEGRCVGGGSEVNSGLYHRIPAEVLDAWRDNFQAEALSDADLHLHYQACEQDLQVGRAPGGKVSPASGKLRDGADALGWHVIETPRCFAYRDGEPAGTKQSMTKTYIPRALRAGCRLLSETRVDSLRRCRDRWVLQATRAGGAGRQALAIEAETVFVAGGATQTPALLRRSGIRKNVGNSLQMHPTVKVVAWFPEEVNDRTMAVPVHQVKEFAPRLTFGCSISSPPHLALGMLEHRQHFARLVHRPGRAAVYYAMISGGGRGSVRSLPFWRDPLVRYRLPVEDLQDLAVGLRNLCRLLLRAGADVLYPCLPDAPIVQAEDDLARLPVTLVPGRSPLMTIHLFSSCPMGEDRRRCAADSFGQVHGVPDLYVADASLLCTSPGVNPQGGIMAIARRNALAFVDKRGAA